MGSGDIDDGLVPKMDTIKVANRNTRAFVLRLYIFIITNNSHRFEVALKLARRKGEQCVNQIFDLELKQWPLPQERFSRLPDTGSPCAPAFLIDQCR